MRKVRYYHQETGRDLVFLTNNLSISALTVAAIYRLRWRIKHCYGTSSNAVKTQIWIAVCVYLMVAIVHKELELPGTLHRTLQLLSVHPYEKISVHELLAETDFEHLESLEYNQLML